MGTSDYYYERLSTSARAVDGVALARAMERCGHRHGTIAEARRCDRMDLDDIGEFADDQISYRYIDAAEKDDDGR
jgi:hypothetical protein